MHPFAKYIQILGKGRNGMRPLSREEAYEAMQMIASSWWQEHRQQTLAREAG